jgi:hypothetical protein
VLTQTRYLKLFGDLENELLKGEENINKRKMLQELAK